MDYIRQLNAFYSQLEYNPVSANAIALWNALLHIANKTRWLEYFTVANKTLEVKSGLESSSLKRARNELVQKKLLIYKKGTGGHTPAGYSLPVLYGPVSEPVEYVPVQYGPVSEPVSEPVGGPVGEPVPDPINKHKQRHKQKHKESVCPDEPDPMPAQQILGEKKNTIKGNRHSYGKYGWVLLSDSEIQRLVNEFGEESVSHYIAYIDEYVQLNKNKNKYKDWNLVVRRAIRDKWGGGIVPQIGEPDIVISAGGRIVQ